MEILIRLTCRSDFVAILRMQCTVALTVNVHSDVNLM